MSYSCFSTCDFSSLMLLIWALKVSVVFDYSLLKVLFSACNLFRASLSSCSCLRLIDWLDPIKFSVVIETSSSFSSMKRPFRSLRFLSLNSFNSFSMEEFFKTSVLRRDSASLTYFMALAFSSM